MVRLRAILLIVLSVLALSAIEACKQKSTVSHRGRMASVPEGSGTAADQAGVPEKISSSVANGFPERFRRELAKNPEWHHLVLAGNQDLASIFAGGGSLLLMTGSRIWRPQIQDGMATGLEELTSEKSQLVFNQTTAAARVTWIQGKVDLSAPGRVSNWVPMSLNADDIIVEGAPGSSASAVKSTQKSDRAKSGAGGGHVVDLRNEAARKSLKQRMENKKFGGTANASKSRSVSKGMSSADDDLIKGDIEFLFWKDGRIAFKEGTNLHVFRKRNTLPAMAVVTPAQRKLNVFVAPFMMAEDLKPGFAPLMVDDMLLPAYAHHNTSVAKDVLLDAGFPDMLIPNMEKALGSWNELLGMQYFKVRKSARKLDGVDCMTLSSACVFWTGSDREISAAGIGGIAMSSYDPVTGVVDGGMISFTNLATSGTSPTAQPPQALVELLTGKSIDARAAAEWQVKVNELGNYRHPAPETVLAYVMTHEFGHYLGLRHNFAGSVYAAPPAVTTSVMEYPPYVLRSGAASAIGQFDVTTINAIYGRGGGDSEETHFCSDSEATAAADPKFEGQFTKVAQCSRMDYGEPAQWWMTLAEMSLNGTLADMPGSEAMKAMAIFEPIRTVNNLAEQLGFFLRAGSGATPQQVQAVRAFLCGRPATEKAAVEEQLARDMGVRLGCN